MNLQNIMGVPFPVESWLVIGLLIYYDGEQMIGKAEAKAITMFKFQPNTTTHPTLNHPEKKRFKLCKCFFNRPSFTIIKLDQHQVINYTNTDGNFIKCITRKVL